MKLSPALIAVFGLGFLYLMTGDSVSVESLSAVMKKVTVGPRSYLVTRLGGGVYNVTTTDAKASLSFGQSGIHSEIGDAKTLSAMRSDVQRFPSNLFA